MPVIFTVTLTSCTQRQDFSFRRQNSGQQAAEERDDGAFGEIVTALIYNSVLQK